MEKSSIYQWSVGSL